MNRALLLTVALLAVGCTENTGPTGEQVILTLTRVDGFPVPRTLMGGGGGLGGSVTVVSGTLEGTDRGPTCTYTIRMESGAEPSGTLADCALVPGQAVSVILNLGGPPAPTGPHSYVFE